MNTNEPKVDSIAKQPNSRSCFVCGLENNHGLHMKFYEPGPGEVKATYRVSEPFQGYPGIVHGGILASMLDEVASRAGMTGEPTRFRFTAKLELRYRKPAPIGETLYLHGWVVEERGSRAVAKADIRLEDGTLLTEAEALLADYPFDVDKSTLAELGWRVYPD
jgi:acyl-coenzyme A thioesterase PaaI-like protein